MASFTAPLNWRAWSRGVRFRAKFQLIGICCHMQGEKNYTIQQIAALFTISGTINHSQMVNADNISGTR